MAISLVTSAAATAPRVPILLGHALYLLATAEGMPVLWCLPNPRLNERDVMAAQLKADHHLISSGRVILADRGLAGAEVERFCDKAGIQLFCPTRATVKSDFVRTRAEEALLRCRQ
ncbi:hypothetical protein Aca07nite_71240 [Actinoplanes capillaceus]|uniref:Transposase DDE domain-containing protein n=1 Tax=Actinoplanes campanulatus TaxID=113559 RepID=A0ABQ3WUA3_9ACTN|nr:hypothetical protein [Actinoplanes capillaceus]GID49849.1 hypothetical protein Aca07nite_71240 [Actinoplanes capillaceus]